MSDLMNEQQILKQTTEFKTKQETIQQEQSVQKDLPINEENQPMKLSKETGKWEVMKSNVMPAVQYAPGIFDGLVTTTIEDEKLDKAEKKELKKRQKELIKDTSHSESEDFHLIDELENNPFKVYDWLKASAAVDGASTSFKELVDAYGKMLTTTGEALQTAYIALTVAADNYLSSHSKNPVRLYGKQRVLICNTIKERADEWVTLVSWQRQLQKDPYADRGEDDNIKTDQAERLEQVHSQQAENKIKSYNEAMKAIGKESNGFIDGLKERITKDMMQGDAKWNEAWLRTLYEQKALMDQANANGNNPEELEKINIKLDAVKLERESMLDGLVGELMSVSETELERFLKDPEYYMNNFARLEYLSMLAANIDSKKENPTDVEYFAAMDPAFREKFHEKSDLMFNLKNVLSKSYGIAGGKNEDEDYQMFFDAMTSYKASKEKVFMPAEKQDQLAREKVLEQMRKENPEFTLSEYFGRHSQSIAKSLTENNMSLKRYTGKLLGVEKQDRHYNYILHFLKNENVDKKTLTAKDREVCKWNEEMVKNYRNVMDADEIIQEAIKEVALDYERVFKNYSKKFTLITNALGDLEMAYGDYKLAISKLNGFIENRKKLLENTDSPEKKEKYLEDIEKDTEKIGIIEELVSKNGGMNEEILKKEMDALENEKKIMRDILKNSAKIKIKTMDERRERLAYYKKSLEECVQKGLLENVEQEVEKIDRVQKILDLSLQKDLKIDPNVDTSDENFKYKEAMIKYNQSNEALMNQMFERIDEMMDFDITEENIRDKNWLAENYALLEKYEAITGNLSNIEDGHTIGGFAHKIFVERLRNIPDYEVVNAKLLLFSTMSILMNLLPQLMGVNYDQYATEAKATYKTEELEPIENIEENYNTMLNNLINGAYKQYIQAKNKAQS